MFSILSDGNFDKWFRVNFKNKQDFPYQEKWSNYAREFMPYLKKNPDWGFLSFSKYWAFEKKGGRGEESHTLVYCEDLIKVNTGRQFDPAKDKGLEGNGGEKGAAVGGFGVVDKENQLLQYCQEQGWILVFRGKKDTFEAFLLEFNGLIAALAEEEKAEKKKRSEGAAPSREEEQTLKQKKQLLETKIGYLMEAKKPHFVGWISPLDFKTEKVENDGKNKLTVQSKHQDQAREDLQNELPVGSLRTKLTSSQQDQKGFPPHGKWSNAKLEVQKLEYRTHGADLKAFPDNATFDLHAANAQDTLPFADELFSPIFLADEKVIHKHNEAGTIGNGMTTLYFEAPSQFLAAAAKEKREKEAFPAYPSWSKKDITDRKQQIETLAKKVLVYNCTLEKFNSEFKRISEFNKMIEEKKPAVGGDPASVSGVEWLNPLMTGFLEQCYVGEVKHNQLEICTKYSTDKLGKGNRAKILTIPHTDFKNFFMEGSHWTSRPSHVSSSSSSDYDARSSWSSSGSGGGDARSSTFSSMGSSSPDLSGGVREYHEGAINNSPGHFLAAIASPCRARESVSSLAKFDATFSSPGGAVDHGEQQEVKRDKLARQSSLSQYSFTSVSVASPTMPRSVPRSPSQLGLGLEVSPALDEEIELSPPRPRETYYDGQHRMAPDPQQPGQPLLPTGFSAGAPPASNTQQESSFDKNLPHGNSAQSIPRADSMLLEEKNKRYRVLTQINKGQRGLVESADPVTRTCNLVFRHEGPRMVSKDVPFDHLERDDFQVGNTIRLDRTNGHVLRVAKNTMFVTEGEKASSKKPKLKDLMGRLMEGGDENADPMLVPHMEATVKEVYLNGTMKLVFDLGATDAMCSG